MTTNPPTSPARSPWTPTRPLRAYLLRLTIAALLPLLACSIVGSAWLAQRERETFERGLRERVRALVSALDAEHRVHTTTLAALATSRALEAGDLATFHAETRRVLASQPEWVTVSLAAPDGRQLVNSLRPFGVELPATLDGESLEEVVRTRRPVVRNLALSNLSGVHEYGVRVPILQDGAVRYVLTALVRVQSLQALVDAQNLPSTWTGVIFDRAHRIVARSINAEAFLGKTGAETLRAAREREHEGWLRGATLEGKAVYTPYRRSELSGWTVAIGIPVGEVDDLWKRTFAYLAALSVVLLAGAFAVSTVVARRITTPVASLAEAARALARGEPPRVADEMPVAEFADLAKALTLAAQAHEQLETIRRQLAGLLESEQRARADAEAANRAKDEFLAMLGHELRNPLSAIRQASYILDSTASPEYAEQARGIVSRQIAHVTRLVDDLLDAARVATGKIVLERVPLDLAQLVRRVIDTTAAAGMGTRHRIVAELESVAVDGDPTRLEQVVSNLLHNAIRYTKTGGTITLRVAAVGDEAVVSVADTGVGMSPQLIARAFDLFAQGERGLERAQGGLGIGLTLVKRLVELHGGHVVAESEGIDRGSTFTVTLPRAARASTTTPAGGPALPANASCRVLIIEDNDDARRMLKIALELAGHAVDERADGASGLAAALEHDYDVVVIDIGLPRMNGFDVARQIRSGRAGSQPLLIALTGYGQPEDQRKARDVGFDAHYVKPVDTAELLRAIAKRG